MGYDPRVKNSTREEKDKIPEERTQENKRAPGADIRVLYPSIIDLKNIRPEIEKLIKRGQLKKFVKKEHDGPQATFTASKEHGKSKKIRG
ncbi:hypothetical protein LIER_20807 [Lithospermum erythrorhizon]|uniref:Uncharacterized protein n=1 Tax=Lithospermum erythrorhizon TaxID=34254 RepID=A0AAV3QQ98_LITER